jgi:WS/DGAT/MGAT family acyltransferase
MPKMPLDDAVFLLGEAPRKPAHVVALQLFESTGEGADLATLYEKMLGLPVKQAFRRHAARNVLTPSGFDWRDEGLDLDYHVRHVALPPPGRIRELLEYVSLQHGVVLDRTRPLWEYHLIGGLADGRFATAFKTHHALADGITLARHTIGGLSPDPKAMTCMPPWAGIDDEEPEAPRPSDPLALPRQLIGTSKATLAALLALQNMASDINTPLPYQAPACVLNGKITGARRFAGDKWPYARLKAVAVGAGGTVNDVVLAMCGGALRGYLADIDELPDRSLIAMVPISLRREGAAFDAGSGNAFGSILCDLQTTTDDPAERLDAIRETMTVSKKRMESLSPGEALAVSRVVMGGAAVAALTGFTSTPRQPFNLVISNVPASPQPLYYNGAQMTDIYPISMISEGQRMNITVTRYADSVTFGIVGDRSCLPHLQRMLVHLEDTLSDLEKAVVPSTKTGS